MIQKSIITTIGFFISLSASAGLFDFIPSKTGDYCKDQAIDYMETQFGEDVEFSGWSRSKQGKTGDYIYWVYTNLCEGTFYFRVPVSSGTCKIAHYWYVPKYVHTVYAEGECQNLISKETYISFDDLTDNHRP